MNVNTENNICVICYCNEDYTLKCADTSCDAKICEDCFKTYLNHCIDTKSLVNCLNHNCKSYIISDSFKKDNDYLDLYKKTLVTAFLNSHGSEVRDKMNVSKKIDDLRKERQHFIKTFPKAIQLVIDIALHKKMNDIGKQNRDHIKNMVKKSHRKCMNSHCNGKLDENFKCMKCETKFCKDCERILKSDHVCKKEDVESIILMSTIVKCPKCLVPIERSEGCSGMTCASCMTKFNYGTGELQDHGSHNVIVGPQKEKFMFDFKGNYHKDIATKLFIVEMNEPKEPSTGILKNTVEKLLKKQEENDADNIEIGNEILISFEKYLKSKLVYINFINTTSYIEELHQKDLLTSYELERILTKNNWIKTTD